MKKKPRQMVADGSYTRRENIEKMAGREVDFVGSMGREEMPSGATVPNRLPPSAFLYRPKRIVIYVQKASCCDRKGVSTTRTSEVSWLIATRLESATARLIPNPVLPRKPERRPWTATASGEYRNSGVSRKDGHSSSTSTIPSAQPSGRVLSRMDQKQAGPAAVSCPRFSEGADGNALGLPHLQLATLDSPKQVPTHSRSHLRRKLQDRKQLAAPTIR